jgi:hypothetical protein
MATRSGDWWNGWKGTSDYNPQQFQSDPNAFTFGGNDQMGTQGRGLGEAMYQSAMGQGPSQAGMQMNRGLAQMGGQLNSTPGLNPAIAARLYSNNAGNMAGQAGMARAQEMQGNRSTLAQYLMQQLQQRGAGQQLDANTLAQINQLKMQQDIANAGNMNQGGWGSTILNMGASAGGAALGMPGIGNAFSGGGGGGIDMGGGMYTNPYGGRTYG